MNQQEYQYLLSVPAIQQCAESMLQLALADKTHFDIQLAKLEEIAELTIGIMRANYPDKPIPLHSRWRHFAVEGHDRAHFLQTLTPLERAQSQLDLAVIAVLLDAGAGSAWRYRDQQGQTFTRSEGLAIASLELFKAGKFSAHANQPWRVDGEVLQRLTLAELSAAFQVSEDNLLLGLAGRVKLLQSLGKVLLENPTVFEQGRPAGLYSYFLKNYGTQLSASDLVHELLRNLNIIWGRSAGGFAVGDMWEYPGLPLGWAPFHKLTLWLTLSLIEPLQTAGLNVIELASLPGLAEYRNGGLFIDGGVLVIKNPDLLMIEHSPGAPLIIEWRALTLAMLSRLAELIRKKLGVTAAALPLVNILQGGTWQAGRQLALQRSPVGEPPLRYHSTGTVF